MLKLLITVAVVVLGLMLWFGRGRTRTPQTPPSPMPADPVAPQTMLSCVRCGLHLPQSDAFLDDRGLAYCGAEHRRLGPGGGLAR